MEIEFYKKNEIENNKLLYAIIVAKYNDKWIFVKNKERDTWEIPAGHREKNEEIEITAKRELFEETGAKEFKIKYINLNSRAICAVFFAQLTVCIRIKTKSSFCIDKTTNSHYN